MSYVHFGTKNVKPVTGFYMVYREEFQFVFNSPEVDDALFGQT